jgi:DNA-binding transcriptional MerR regulator
VRRLRAIKKLQAERLTLREITDRLGASSADATAATTLTARIRALEEEIDRLNHDLAELAPRLDRADSPAERQAVAQVAGPVLGKTLLLAQWLATLLRDSHSPLA